ncbi:uncharacterized protein Dwil_GK19498 [Drosophila willistoni]|uniref:RNA methyltransferase n=1 Tax=Drosophila willistoni TaxID=7260 RepID=B4MNV6_DROWI|nr:uncharacterized protein Dwil_GK19498 [Drosophila willistoni]
MDKNLRGSPGDCRITRSSSGNMTPTLRYERHHSKSKSKSPTPPPTGSKKYNNKTWSKRQHNNKTGGKHNTTSGGGGGGGGGGGISAGSQTNANGNNQNSSGGGSGSSINATGSTGGSTLVVLPTAMAAMSAAAAAHKADLENIQNIKTQIVGHTHSHGIGVGGGTHHGGSGGSSHHGSGNHHHHHNTRLAQNTTASGGGGVGNGLPIGPLDKHGLKAQQQLYKKMLAHRGHHNHVLCAGNNANHTCCLVTGCNGNSGAIGGVGKDTQSNKDTSSLSGNSSISGSVAAAAAAANAVHYCCGRSKFFLPEKRLRKEVIVPPTKFLLGGNISDPLNLNSLQHENTSNASSSNNTPATTPRQSPITTPPKVEVIIPPNIHDPLHLLDPVDSMEYEKQLTSPMKRGGVMTRGSHLKLQQPSNQPHHRQHRPRKNRKRRRYDSNNTSHAGDDMGEGSGETLSISLDEAIATAGGTGGGPGTASSSAASPVAPVAAAAGTAPAATNAAALLLSEAASAAETLEMVQQQAHVRSPQAAATAEMPPTQLQTEALAGTQSSLTSSSLEQMECNITSITLPAAEEVTSLMLSPQQQQQQEQQQQQQSPSTTERLLSGEVSSASTSAATLAVASTLAERRALASRDLRLDLGSTCYGVGGTGLSFGTSSAASVGSAGGSSGGGGRKRKISESNNSLKSKKFHRHDAMDKIVSPVVPQPGAWKRPPRQLQPTGARKPNTRRSTSFSETELPSPIDELPPKALPLIDVEIPRDDTPELSEHGLGSPLSTISAATSQTAGEQDSLVAADAISTTNSEAAQDTQEQAIVGIMLEPSSTLIQPQNKLPKFRADGLKYRYGNFDRYVDFRQLNEFRDVRLQVFQRHPELFQNKDILDIGCNVGHMTITVARHLAPKTILGIDIDRELVARARRNLSIFVRIPKEEKRLLQDIKTELQMPQQPMAIEKTEPIEESSTSGQTHKKTRRARKRRKAQQQQHQQQQLLQQNHHQHHHHHHHHDHQQEKLDALLVKPHEFFPISFPLTYGGMPNLPTSEKSPCNASSSSTKNQFPQNVFFRYTNYVLKDESLMANDTQQYDLILCLSVTKWIHLNFGDAGLKLAFKRMFNQLRPGGKLILEAQNWASYKKKKNLTPEIYNNYKQIEFFPNKFHEYLLSSEVGFSHSYTMGVPRHMNKGFCRPIQLYAKGDYTPNHVRWSDAYYPQTPYEAYRGIYATLPVHGRMGGGGGSSGGASSSHHGGHGHHQLMHLSSSTRSQNYDTPHYAGSASGSASCRQTPMYQPTYNPLETDSYQPSYDMEYLNHMYVFASPLYQTVWSPPASLRKSSSHTPVFGSVRDAELDGDGSIGGGGSGGGSYHRHVYPPNDDTCSPNANACNAFNSIRDADTDDSNQLPSSSRRHVYATNCGESSSSPQVNHHEATGEYVDALMDDEQKTLAAGSSSGGGGVAGGAGVDCDLSDA